MKRIILAATLGAFVCSLSFGFQKDTTAVVDTSNRKIDSVAVLPQSAIIPGDTLASGSKDTLITQRDTLSIQSDTLRQETPLTKDTVSARKDTTIQEASKVRPAPAKTPALKSDLLDPNGYKDVHWGMTLKDTREYLVDHDNVDEYEIQSITNGFEYQGTVAAVKSTISYQFDNDRLYIVRLAPKVKAVSRFDFLDSFEDYQTTLEAKYGKPTRGGFHKIDEQYLNTIESIQLGFAKKYALWEFERTYLVLVLAGHNKRLDIHITYVSRAIFDELKDRIETMKLEDF